MSTSIEWTDRVKPRLEYAHLEHRGMGGNPTGDRTQPEKLITLCFICHGLFDAGLIGKAGR